jgi:hypothetical protein
VRRCAIRVTIRPCRCGSWSLDFLGFGQMGSAIAECLQDAGGSCICSIRTRRRLHLSSPRGHGRTPQRRVWRRPRGLFSRACRVGRFRKRWGGFTGAYGDAFRDRWPVGFTYCGARRPSGSGRVLVPRSKQAGHGEHEEPRSFTEIRQYGASRGPIFGIASQETLGWRRCVHEVGMRRAITPASG